MAAQPRAVRRGQVLFSDGDPGNMLNALISGWVKVLVRPADGSKKTDDPGPGGEPNRVLHGSFPALLIRGSQTGLA